jgi:hypothetical protein
VDARELGRQVAGHLLEALGELSAQGGLSPGEVARLSSVPDSIRWGDSKTITTTANPSGAPEQTITTQIVRVNGKVPRAWVLSLLCDVPDGLASEGTLVFTLIWLVTIGVGSASATLRIVQTMTAASLAASGNQVAALPVVAGQDVQIAASIIAPPGTGSDETFSLTALAAPFLA